MSHGPDRTSCGPRFGSPPQGTKGLRRRVHPGWSLAAQASRGRTRRANVHMRERRSLEHEHLGEAVRRVVATAPDVLVLLLPGEHVEPVRAAKRRRRPGAVGPRLALGGAGRVVDKHPGGAQRVARLRVPREDERALVVAAHPALARSDLVRLAHIVEQPDELVLPSLRVVPRLPQGVAQRVLAPVVDLRLVPIQCLLRPVVDDRNAPRHHDQGQDVLDAEAVVLAIPRKAAVLVVVVGEVPEQVEVLVRIAAQLQVQHRAEPSQVRAVVPSALLRVVPVLPAHLVGAEAARHLVEGHEVQQAREHGAVLRVALEGAVVGEVVHRRLAQDLHTRSLLHLLEEGLGHVDGGVEAEGVDVECPDEVLDVLQELLPHEGHALVEVAQGGEPALRLLDRVVARASQAHVAGEAVAFRLLGDVGTTLRHAALDHVLQDRQVRLLLLPIRGGRWRLGVIRKGLARLPAGLVVVLRLVERVKAFEVELVVHLQRPHVIQHDVHHKAHALTVERPAQFLHRLLCAPMMVDLEEVGRVVAHETIGLDGGRDPNAVETHALDVWDLVDDALQRAAAPTTAGVIGPVCLQPAEGVIVCLVTAACKSVGHQKVNALAGQSEGLLQVLLFSGCRQLLPGFQTQQATVLRASVGTPRTAILGCRVYCQRMCQDPQGD
mmetsp:Transcript_97432/g.303431  ORF Transcript_97432/g.303431 Transcript_97432/m.303431 type:complete len:663 (-) Transcript_97432:47-2035(-)